MLQTKFLIQGTNVSIIKMNTETALDQLPPKIYSVKFDPLQGFYLNMHSEQFPEPAQIYGTINSRVDKCLSTYQSRDKSTGILLTGDKGTGKTLLMTLLSNRVVAELKLPVIMVNEPHNGEQFSSFIDGIGECCLVFDEFGKMYNSQRDGDDRPRQESLLSLLDGPNKIKRMILLSENSELDINDFLKNRPSRVYYHFKYTKLEVDSIVGYCQDLEVPLVIIDEIVELSRKSKIFTFDMLQCIVEEYLRFEQPITTIVEELNIDTRPSIFPQLQIVKVINKHTGEEHQVIESILNQPGQYDNSGFRVLHNDSPVTKNNSNVRGYVSPYSKIDDEEDNYDYVSLSTEGVTYTSGDVVVYETSKYTVTTKMLPAYQPNYSLLA